MASTSFGVVVDTSKDVTDYGLGSPKASSLVLYENKQIGGNYMEEMEVIQFQLDRYLEQAV